MALSSFRPYLALFVSVVERLLKVNYAWRIQPRKPKKPQVRNNIYVPLSRDLECLRDSQSFAFHCMCVLVCGKKLKITRRKTRCFLIALKYMPP